MTFKMIIAASLALGVQFASASAPSNCAANANGEKLSGKSQKESLTTVAALTDTDGGARKEAAPASTGTR